VHTQTYEVTFMGQADTALRAEFDDYEVSIGQGTTTLRADLSDQRALDRLMERIIRQELIDAAGNRRNHPRKGDDIP
jgi:hypothetical protein